MSIDDLLGTGLVQDPGAVPLVVAVAGHRDPRPQDLPVVVVPGADHFFHRRLHLLRAIIRNGWK